MSTEATTNVDEIEKKLDQEVAIETEDDKVDVADPDKNMVSDSHTGSGVETASDPVSTQLEEKEPIKTQEPEAEPLSECIDINDPTQVDAGKEAASPESGAIEEVKPGHQEQEVEPTEIETSEPVQTADVSDGPSQPGDPEAASQPETETTKETAEHSAQVLCSTEAASLVKQEPLPSEPEKESTEKLQQGKVHTEESSGSGGPSDEPSDASEIHPPQQQMLATELEEEGKPQPVAFGLEDKPREHETGTEELESKDQGTDTGAALEAAQQEVVETESLKVEEDGNATETAEIVSTEAHANAIESPSSEAEKVLAEEVTKSENLNELNAAEQVENEASNKEEIKETSAVEVLSREVAEQELSAQEAHQADTVSVDDGNDSSLEIAAEKVVTDVGNEEEAQSAEVGEQTAAARGVKKEAIEEGNVKTEDEVPADGNVDVQAVPEAAEQVTEAVKEDNHPETKPESVEEATRESDTAITQASEDSGEPPVKQKQSNNIFSKVKQSLVKAKKAITGKSPNSKTVTSDVNAQ